MISGMKQVNFLQDKQKIKTKRQNNVRNNSKSLLQDSPQMLQNQNKQQAERKNLKNSLSMISDLHQENILMLILNMNKK